MDSATSISLDRAFVAISKARRHATRKYGSGTPCSDTLPCPACGVGVLQYRVLAPHGRMEGKCNTHNCVSWKL